MKNVKILDCTLRDGGRIIDCQFPNDEIYSIANKLSKAKIDIIEIGFLRDWHNVSYEGNSTFFTDVDQITPFIKEGSSSEYVAFIDYGMFDFDSLKECDGKSVTGIRVGFTKKDKENNMDEVIRCLKLVKEKGYKLFIQGVNTLNYSDKEVLELVDLINEIKPYSFGIVDTYGAMYMDDVDRFFALIDNNMDSNICIDFHSHNNYQMSFALAQHVIQLSRGVRTIIIDATLNGMGKVAGNLNTELIVDYMVRKMKYDYDFDIILDLIDDYVYPYRNVEEWGYSIPALFSGVYQSHPNNVRYLLSKFRLQSKDIKNIMGMITPELRQKYDYENIDKLYKSYNNSTLIDDMSIIENIKNEIKDREVVILVPGKSLKEERDKIEEYIQKKDVFVISVNHVSNMADWAFCGNSKQFEVNDFSNKKTIITSNIKSDEADYKINYYGVVNMSYRYYDNSTFMLLNLLKKSNVKEIAIAGLDGFDTSVRNNYVSERFQNKRHIDEFNDLNVEIRRMLRDYCDLRKGECKISFITQSPFADIVR